MIFAIRMFGLFIVFPVISLYARTLPGADPFWLGMALGGYGLSQALFQIPFGMLSDRFGRKTMIVLGLLIFAGGSVAAATAHTVMGLFIGRLIQGSGAVASVIIALMADLTREEFRTRAMAGIGVSIGLSFAVGMVVGPIVGAHYGVASLFWLTGFLSVAGIAIILFVVPSPQGAVHKNEMELSLSQLGIFLDHHKRDLAGMEGVGDRRADAAETTDNDMTFKFFDHAFHLAASPETPQMPFENDLG